MRSGHDYERHLALVAAVTELLALEDDMALTDDAFAPIARVVWTGAGQSGLVNLRVALAV
jgi:hypothetical protein